MNGDLLFCCGNTSLLPEILVASCSYFTSVFLFFANIYPFLIESWSDPMICCWVYNFKENITYIGVIEVVRLAKGYLKSSLEEWVSFIHNLANISFFQCHLLNYMIEVTSYLDAEHGDWQYGMDPNWQTVNLSHEWKRLLCMNFA